MNRKELAHWRMRTHRLWTAPLARPAEVVRWFGAMQAQEFVPAKWAIAQRCGRADDDQIERLYATGEILRTHLIRPTWHFVHRDDIRWVIEATKYRVHQINGTYYRQCGVDDDTFKRCAKAFTKALKGGNELNRRELVEVLKKGAGIEATGLRMGYLLMRAELDAVIVSGSVGGKQPTFACFDERVPETAAVSHDEAVAELTLRYFRSRGPTTLKDFIRWSSLTVAEAKAGLSSVRSELRQRDIDGRTYFFVKAASGQPPSSPRIDLIQGYDEYSHVLQRQQGCAAFERRPSDFTCHQPERIPARGLARRTANRPLEVCTGARRRLPWRRRSTGSWGRPKPLRWMSP